jgi:hypothetical protein
VGIAVGDKVGDKVAYLFGSTYPLPYATNNEPKWGVAVFILSTFLWEEKCLQKSGPSERIEPKGKV